MPALSVAIGAVAAPDKVDRRLFGASTAINYHHFHSALDSLDDALRGLQGTVARSHLASFVAAHHGATAMHDVIAAFPSQANCVSVVALRRAIAHAKLWRQQFALLGIRGFSPLMKGLNKR